MSFIAYQHSAGARSGQFSGTISRIDDTWTTDPIRIHLPISCSTILHPPSVENYGNRQYAVGGHTANLVIDEEFRCHRQGIPPPSSIPSVAVGAGATVQICYLRYLDELTGEKSPLSAGKTVTGNITRVWSSLPSDVVGERIILEGTAAVAAGVVTGTKTTFGHLRPGDRIAISADLTRWGMILTITSDVSMTIDDTNIATAGDTLFVKPLSRVSHVEMWVSVTGALPRFAARVPIGTTTFTEATATLALGEAFIDNYEPMPFGSMNCFYNDRQLVAGVEGHLDTVYLSAIGYPERFEGLSYITSYNEPIVGIFKYRDYVVLLCPDSSYKLQGYTVDDYTRTVLEPDIGGLGHLGNKVAEGQAFVPGRKGIQIFNGAFHIGNPSRRAEWTTDYLRYHNSFEMGMGVVNPNDSTYQFYPLSIGVSETIVGLVQWSGLILLADAYDKAFISVGDYGVVGASQNGGFSPAEWTSDTHLSPSSGLITCAAYLTPAGQRTGHLYRGDTEGRIYEEYEIGSIVPPPESGLLLAPWTSVIVPAHLLMGDPGGGPREGKRLIRLWSYVVSEDSAWEIALWPGDEYAYPPDILNAQSNAVVPGFVEDVAASALSTTGATGTIYQGYTLTYQKQSVHNHIIQGTPIVGRGFSIEYRFITPISAAFIGVGGVWIEPGDATRPVWFAYNPA